MVDCETRNAHSFIIFILSFPFTIFYILFSYSSGFILNLKSSYFNTFFSLRFEKLVLMLTSYSSIIVLFSWQKIQISLLILYFHSCVCIFYMNKLVFKPHTRKLFIFVYKDNDTNDRPNM